MKNIVCHNNYPVLNKNGNMLRGVGHISIKDFLRQMSALKQAGVENGLSFKTSAEIPKDAADAFLFVDMPEVTDPFYIAAIKTRKPLYLLSWESDIINPRNSISAIHGCFKKVFTYDDSLVGTDPRYVKVPYSFHFLNLQPRGYTRKQFCCMIAANKFSTDPRELYTARREIIEMHEKSEINDFDLYGLGWDKLIPPRGLMDRVLNKLPSLLTKNYPKVYRGRVEDKIDVLRRYKFSVCFENAYGSPGYISEKIFDSFFAGCIPIYMGAPNIADYIPRSCYIDPRNYSNNYEMFSDLRAFSSEQCEGYVQSISDFLLSQKGGIFCVSSFCMKIIKNILASKL